MLAARGLWCQFSLEKSWGALLLQKRLGEANGNAEVRAAEAFQDRERDADDFALLVEDRTAGTTGGGLGVEDELIGQHVADVALRDERADQAALRQFAEDLRDVAIALLDDLIERIFVGAREDGVEARGVTHHDDSIARYRAGFFGIDREHRPLQILDVDAHRCEVRVLRNLLDLRREGARVAREIGADIGNFGLKALRRDVVQLIIFPPRLGDVTIGDDAPVCAGEEAGAEDVYLHFGTAAAGGEERIAVAILQRIAFGIEAGVAERLAALLFAEGDRNMEQANAAEIQRNQILNGVAGLLDTLEPRVRVGELLLESGYLRGVGIGHLRFQIVGLLLERLFVRSRGRVDGLFLAGLPRAGHQILRAAKAAFQAREGVKLTFLPFFAQATVEALKVHPQLNAVINAETSEVTYHDAEHLGIAVDTQRGLIVPVIHNAGDLNIGGLARKISDIAGRARSGQVTLEDLAGGTFTLTNTGSRGALFDTPIINQPQVGILGIGTVVKRPVVVEDPALGEVIAVRSVVYLALTYDHRLVDGADAARFLGTVKNRLEEGAFEAELGL